MTMGITAFPDGISSFGIPLIGTGPILTTGDIKFVDSNHANASDTTRAGSKTEPFATLDYGIGQLTADQGDFLILMPNHAETVTGVAGIALDVAGISVIGLGRGAQRPRILMDGGTTVTAVISAADVTVSNIEFASGHSDIVTCFGVTATGARLDNLHFTNNAANENWLTCIKATGTTDGEADGLEVTNCRWGQLDVGSLEFIELNADVTNGRFNDNYVVNEGTASPLILCATGKDLKYVEILRNYVSHKMTSGTLLVNNDTTGTNNSGIAAWNMCRHADVTTTHDLGVEGMGLGLFENRSTSVNNLSGLVLPAIDVNS
jgi:hypothetical protein